MFVGAQVVDPKLRCPRCFCCWFAVEKEDVGLDALRVEDAGRLTQLRVNVGLFEELASHSLAGTAFEEDVVRYNDRGAAVLLQDGEDVLKEVELFVAGARPEIVAMHD